MSFILANFLGNGSGTSNSDSSNYSDENKQIIIEKLTAKMVNSVHLEDRKAAAMTIKSLARSHRLEIGTLALEALFEELRRDLDDEELARIVLETVDIITAKSDGNSGGEFCEILLKNEANVGILLDLMGDSNDFYLKFTSIQILTSLCTSQPFQLQTAILQSPSGVAKVMDLLKDSREIIRNEGLLLGIGLVEGNNRDLQKVLVFQGAFEEVFKIIVEAEGGPWTGLPIIQDAFNLISGILNLNTSNQNYFRDSFCFKQLAGLLAVPHEDDADNLWNQTRILNYLAALKVLDGLLCKENVDLEASQNAALRTNFIKPLLFLAFNPQIPLQVSASALNCLTGLIWSNPRSQQEFAKERLIYNPLSSNLGIELPISSLMGAVLVSLHGNVSQLAGFDQRIRALELVEAFCVGNPEGQLVLISTVKGDNSSLSAPGTAILESIFDLDSSRKRDPWHCWFASILLAHLIDGNEAAKQVLLKHTINEDDEEVLTVLMLNLVRIGNDSRGSTCQKSIIGYLQLLVIWFHDSPGSINKILKEGSFVQYLLERITQQSSTLETEIQGLCALILGICVLFNDESVKEFSGEALKGIIKNRIGPDLFVSRLSRLRSLGDKNECLNYKISQILMKNYDNLMNLVVRPTPAGSKASQTATLAQLTSDLNEAQTLLATTRADLSETAALADKLKIGIKERDDYISKIQKIIGEKNQKIAQMAQELSNNSTTNGVIPPQQDQLSQCQEDQITLQNLTETIKMFKETVARQQARIEELEAALNGNGTSGELEKWKEAYHRLYDQVREQLNFENTSTSTNNEDNAKTLDDSEVIPKGPSLKIVSEHCESSSFDTSSDANNVSEHNSHVTVTSESIEILSPSMFMSPLAESTSVISETNHVETVESVSELTVSTSELISLNQIPVTGKGNEYPELNEQQDTTVTAALIVSEEFALNEPNTSTDEVIQSISSECPPYNFLSSEAEGEGISVDVASKEEINQVLSFFDNLPAVGGSAASIQEGLDHLNIEDVASEDNRKEVVESTETADINDFSFVPSGNDSFDNFGPNIKTEGFNVHQNDFTKVLQEINSDVIAEEQADYNANLATSEDQIYSNSADPYTTSENSQEYNTESLGYSQETTDDYTHDYNCESTQDFSTPQYADYSSQYSETVDASGYGEYHDYQKEATYDQVPIANEHQEIQTAEPEASTHDNNQAYTGYNDQGDHQYQNEVNYYNNNTEGEMQATNNSEYPAESNAEYPVNPSTSIAENSVEYNTEYSYPTEYNAEYSYSTEANADYSYYTENKAEYSTEHNSEYPSEYAQENTTDYSQSNPQEYSTDYSQNVTDESQPAASNQPQDEYYYYDESTGFTYGFDHNVQQYYYYDPNTGQYVYYTADDCQQQQQQGEVEAIHDVNNNNNNNNNNSNNNSYDTNNTGNESVASSNPSLFDTNGPPIISLQHHHADHQQPQVQSSMLSTNNFVSDQIYNI